LIFNISRKKFINKKIIYWSRPISLCSISELQGYASSKIQDLEPDDSEVTLGVNAYDCSAVDNSSLFDAINNGDNVVSRYYAYSIGNSFERFLSYNRNPIEYRTIRMVTMKST
jgi:hypothetical protein